ncbi:hydantoinase B/oxoprolinase family protein [Chondrinema litorale]|uniref:hydantoinase B/oxoprolinase family protein n=1 Tax=Chondrinema litorale TaxID=2994555 RepID=UPI002542EB23|nr:hydantoinase B/oxoprolinase family protein [Chondrinema litorale]UZR93219.1 hydantoinase B/oxoprolinase family protein [Chondrinema litorale]
MGIWKIWADTGGTFTDCIALTPSNQVKRVKLLSNSSLKGRFEKQLSDNVFQASLRWDVEKDIFKGYQLSFAGVDQTYTIVKVDLAKQTIQLKEAIEETALEETLFSITANEEAPVMAARMVTETALEETLPLVAMRVGSTRGTNALLERKGAPTALLITKGFEDLMEIGDQTRPDIFALNIQKTPVLHERVISIDERINASGQVLNPLSQDEIAPVINALKKEGINTVAISLMHSYLNNTHEQKLKKYLKAFGIKYISASAELEPSINFLSRTGTALINAYLAPVIDNYVSNIISKIPDASLKIMTSAGGLTGSGFFKPKDSLLSGPAGGVVGAAAIAEKSNIKKIITLDMGGTSTDVARYDDGFDYQYETEIAGARLMAPSLAIHTVAAGGGSVCQYDGFKFSVGPESAGAFPGPACYGNNGPLSITDVNLLLGRVDPKNFGIPLNIEKAQATFNELVKDHQNKEEILTGFLQIANEKMADAIRKISVSKGYNPTEYSLLAFGGAGGQHACDIADLLNMDSIVIPYDAGLLSAYGMGQALVERFATEQVLKSFDNTEEYLNSILHKLSEDALNQLRSEGYLDDEIEIREQYIYLRYKGQNYAIEIPIITGVNIKEEYYNRYKKLYGYLPEDREIEIESVKVIASTKKKEEEKLEAVEEIHTPEKSHTIKTFIGGAWKEIPVFIWEELKAGASIKEPALLISKNSTVIIESNWELTIDQNNTALLKQSIKEESKEAKKEKSKPEAVQLELFTNRFTAIAEEMGALLQRTALSVNIKERLDFSCALLDKDGYLVVNAPHIPVHLGSMGLCVRKTIAAIDFEQGDVVITNHPAYGGSHLPDITLIAAIFDNAGNISGYVANRAHHAEIGGISPGSFPVKAKNLAEEGVVISPTYLVKNGKAKWKEIEQLFTESPYPSRSVQENIADLNASLASINAGKISFEYLLKTFGSETVAAYMKKLSQYAVSLVEQKLDSLQNQEFSAEEKLDDQTIIKVKITKENNQLQIDFTGTAQFHSGNLNATEAITRSVILYVLRLWLNEEVPLNEGLMEKVKLILPVCFLNPDFHSDAESCPAVAGGNTETSQRLTDTLLKALKLAACSQGTMNNLLFGNESFGYYETICGGVGAGDGFNGASATHQHMTNTRITDPEILELRYPVRLDKFAIRTGSGGKGKYTGGDGIERQISFLTPVELTLLTQHRVEKPYGLAGGEAGSVGMQILRAANGTEEALPNIVTVNLNPGDAIKIFTPGGGGYGK